MPAGAEPAKSAKTSAKRPETAKSVSADPKKRTNQTRSGTSAQGRRVARSPEQLKKAGTVKPPTGVARTKAAETAVKRTEVGIHTVNSQKVIPFPTAFIFMTLIATLLFMCMIMSYVRINEYTIGIETLESQKSDLASQVKELTLELEKKNNLKVIEEYATNVLGMVKIDQLTKKYITVEVEDKIEVVDENNTIVSKISEFFDSVRRNFTDLFKYVG